MSTFFFPSPSPYLNTTSTNDAPTRTIHQHQKPGHQSKWKKKSHDSIKTENQVTDLKKPKPKTKPRKRRGRNRQTEEDNLGREQN
jgi:hypothetical protein